MTEKVARCSCRSVRLSKVSRSEDIQKKMEQFGNFGCCVANSLTFGGIKLIQGKGILRRKVTNAMLKERRMSH